MPNFNIIPSETGLIKAWNNGVQFEESAVAQLKAVASLPFVIPHVAAMPDCHWGMGATVGSVIPTVGAIIPASVGVDIGCGMIAVRTNIQLSQFAPAQADIEPEGPRRLKAMFDAISHAVPHGRTDNGGNGDRGAWHDVPADIQTIWDDQFEFEVNACKRSVFAAHPNALHRRPVNQLGTLGTGNHFIELCTEIDNPDSQLWVVIHSGSRGFGNKIGTYFTNLAKHLCNKYFVQLPDPNLAYLAIGTQEYEDYLGAVALAQKYAWLNREIMMARVLGAIGAQESGPAVFGHDGDGVPSTIHIHHNYVQPERHFGKNVMLTRKGAVDASEGNWTIIPGSMGAKTYLGVGLGNRDSFHSCSHGAGRAMSRTAARKLCTVEQHAAATEGIVCDKTAETLDETPAAYKDIDRVMESQADLVRPVVALRQLVCVKGLS